MEIPKPITSEAIWAASERIAIELAKYPPAISTQMKTQEVARTRQSFFIAALLVPIAFSRSSAKLGILG